MVEYTKEELEQIHKLTTEMAKYYVSFCQEHNLLCYLCGGGCIGTIRHKGYIPWDDDLDFFMPREDYNKFLELWKNEDHPRYKMSNETRTYRDRNNYATIRDAETTQIKPYQADLDIVHGLVLDIIPIDGRAPEGIERKMQVIYALIYSLYRTSIVPTKHGKLLQVGSWILLNLVPKALHYPIWRYCEKKMTKYPLSESEYMTELCCGPATLKKIYPSKAFEAAIFKPFEDTEMPIPIGYHDYLTVAFGDYMQLPPKDKQKAHHEVVLLDLEKSYIKYKGIAYLTEK